jgi:hypothetical protein
MAPGGSGTIGAAKRWTRREVTVPYASKPAARVSEAKPGRLVPDPGNLVFAGETRDHAHPVMAEICVPRLLDRNEFRRVCDAKKDPAAILAKLRRKGARRGAEALVAQGGAPGRIYSAGTSASGSRDTDRAGGAPQRCSGASFCRARHPARPAPPRLG